MVFFVAALVDCLAVTCDVPCPRHKKRNKRRAPVEHEFVSGDGDRSMLPCHNCCFPRLTCQGAHYLEAGT